MSGHETTTLAVRDVELPAGASLYRQDGVVLGLVLPDDLPFDSLEAVADEAERLGLTPVEEGGLVLLVDADGAVVEERDPDCYVKLMTDVFDYIDWLAEQASVSQMVLADAMNHGDRVYGERYAQWIDQSGYGYGSLANIAWVGREVPLDIRVPGLSYYHYVQVAPLDDLSEKREWLEKAAREGLTGRALGAEIGRKRLLDEGRDPDLYEAERGVGRAVQALQDVSPERWADVVWSKFLWPLRHMCEPPEFQRFVARLKNRLAEGGNG